MAANNDSQTDGARGAESQSENRDPDREAGAQALTFTLVHRKRRHVNRRKEENGRKISRQDLAQLISRQTTATSKTTGERKQEIITEKKPMRMPSNYSQNF